MARRRAHDVWGRGALGADVIGSDVAMPAGIKQLLDAENKATDQVQEARKSEYPRLFLRPQFNRLSPQCCQRERLRLRLREKSESAWEMHLFPHAMGVWRRRLWGRETPKTEKAARIKQARDEAYHEVAQEQAKCDAELKAEMSKVHAEMYICKDTKYRIFYSSHNV
jgi:hypothetical protein